MLRSRKLFLNPLPTTFDIVGVKSKSRKSEVYGTSPALLLVNVDEKRLQVRSNVDKKASKTINRSGRSFFPKTIQFKDKHANQGCVRM